MGLYIEKVFKKEIPHYIVVSKVFTEKKKVIYEDEGIVVELAPRDPELPELVYNFIRRKGRPVLFQELVKEFSGIVGEDRVRRAVSHLLALKKIMEFPDGSLGSPDMVWTPSSTRRKRRKRVARLMDIGESPRTIYTIA